MPYKNLSDLPHPLHTLLPHHAQEIYLAAFNKAWDEYKDPDKRKTSETREEIAHKVAWTAVKQKYVNQDGQWVKK